jgi:hypothetical protein
MNTNTTSDTPSLRNYSVHVIPDDLFMGTKQKSVDSLLGLAKNIVTQSSLPKDVLETWCTKIKGNLEISNPIEFCDGMSECIRIVSNSKIEIQEVKGSGQDPILEKEAWTFQKAMDTFKIPEELMVYVKRLFENDPDLYELNLRSTSRLDSYSRQSYWSRRSKMYFQCIRSEHHFDNLEYLGYIGIGFIF